MKHPVCGVAATCLALTILAGLVCSGELGSRGADAPKSHGRALEVFRKRMGLFIHRHAGQILSDGRRTKDGDDFAEVVDVDKVCDDIARFGFEYVLLTDFHALGSMLRPSEARPGSTTTARNTSGWIWASESRSAKSASTPATTASKRAGVFPWISRSSCPTMARPGPPRRSGRTPRRPRASSVSASPRKRPATSESWPRGCGGAGGEAGVYGFELVELVVLAPDAVLTGTDAGGNGLRGVETYSYYIGSWSLYGFDDAFVYMHLDSRGEVVAGEINGY